MQDKPKLLSLFKDDNDIEKGISDDLVRVLKKSKHPHIICIYGNARLGKSTKMNQIIQGIKSNNYFKLTKPFETRIELHTIQTKGCNFYGPVKVKDILEKNDLDINEFDKNIINDDLFFVDTEGLKSIDPITKAFVAGILTILQIASIKILFLPNLDNEKLEEIDKNTKLSNILNIPNNTSETIVLIRDIPLTGGKNLIQMRNEMEIQKETLENKINDYLKKDKIKKALCEILPSYELAKNNVNEYQNCYKEQMQNLIFSIMTNIKANQNIDGKKIIGLIIELLEIFKQVKNIESLNNAGNALNQVILNIFKAKLEKIYINIKSGNSLNYLVSMSGNNENIKSYLLDCIKTDLKYTWNIYNDSIKKEIEVELDNYCIKLQTVITSYINQIKEKMNKEINSFKNNVQNKEIKNYLSRFQFFEEVNMNDLNSFINRKINDFISKNSATIHICKIKEKKYEENLKLNLKNNIDNNIKYIIKSLPKWREFKMKILKEIKIHISDPFLNKLISKKEEEIKFHLNNNLNVLKNDIQSFISLNKIKIFNKKEFDAELNTIYVHIKAILKDIIASMEVEKLKREKLISKSIADGIYYIRCIQFQNKYLQLDREEVELWDKNNDINQRFEIKYEPSGKYYTIKNLKTNKYLFSSIIVVGSDCPTFRESKWHILLSDDSNYEIISESNDYLLGSFRDEGNENGIKVACLERKGKLNQRFNFEPFVEKIEHVIKYFPLPNFHHPFSNPVSIVDALGSIGADFSKEYRFKIGIRNEIQGIPFSPEYNTEMLRRMKEGRLIVP